MLKLPFALIASFFARRTKAAPCRAAYGFASKALLENTPLNRLVASGVSEAPMSPDCILGWGRKRSGRKAVHEAVRRGVGYVLLEDGFLRSMGRKDDEVSIAFDDQGIYYDASAPSRIEALIAAPLDELKQKRAQNLCDQWRTLRLSKYNAAREFAGVLPEKYVLVVDQTAGDFSIHYGLADASSFHRMLAAALSENPEATVVVKMHPDIYTRKKAGHFDPAELRKNPRLLVVAENCHPVRLLERAQKVYCVTSQMGFEALLGGKTVRCFGMPFYAGWGLTEDELACCAGSNHRAHRDSETETCCASVISVVNESRVAISAALQRRGSATLEQLIHAALVDYPRYLDPERNQRCEVETVMAHIGLQRQMRMRFPETVYATGFSKWKRPHLVRFLRGSTVRFIRKSSVAPSGSTLAVWGNADYPVRESVRLVRVEDGFLRSSGLGARLTRPLSWVFDETGLYYDAAKPSRLEHLLQTHEFEPSLIERARTLRETIVSGGISKYNLSPSAWQRPASAKRVVLVPGQVENDASIRHGAAGISTNLGLLQAVRAQCPDAYLVYKPHPDVVAGLRCKGANEHEAARWCDAIVTDGDVVQLLGQVDELHVLTSLAGFEALLRGIPVTCHGQPFYAGWGLTTDRVPPARRTRRRSLDELVAATLILYPTYVSRTTNQFTSPERAVEELAEWRMKEPKT